MSGLPSRIARIEVAAERQALAYVQCTYELTEADLLAAQDLHRLCTTQHFLPVAEMIRHMMRALEEVDTDAGIAQQAFTDKLHDLQRQAGVDPDKLSVVCREIMAAFAPPEVVTIDTLIELDRRAYEAAAIDSGGLTS
jgi:hypothetical protein